MQMSIHDHVFNFHTLNTFADLTITIEPKVNLIDLQLECLDHKFWLRERH